MAGNPETPQDYFEIFKDLDPRLLNVQGVCRQETSLDIYVDHLPNAKTLKAINKRLRGLPHEFIVLD